MRLALDAASRPGRIECGTNLLVSMSFSMAQKGNWWILMKMKLDLEYLKHSETIFNMCVLSCPRFSGASFGDGMKRSFNMVSPGHLLDIYLFFFRQGEILWNTSNIIIDQSTNFPQPILCPSGLGNGSVEPSRWLSQLNHDGIIKMFREWCVSSVVGKKQCNLRKNMTYSCHSSRTPPSETVWTLWYANRWPEYMYTNHCALQDWILKWFK